MAGRRVIIRVEHTDHYTVVRNQTLRDSRLSLKATGLLAYLLSLPDDSALSREQIAEAKRDGEDSVRAGLRELARAGYIKHKRVQDQYGRWRTEATVYEHPQLNTEGGKPTVGTEGGKARTDGGLTGGGKPPTIRSNKEGPAHASPPPPPEDLCAACDAAGEYMRADGTWFCEEHRALRLVGDGEA